MPDVYAISSAKGGVGKTTTAANLAATLAAAGHSVVAVDGDIGTPNLGSALGVTPGPGDSTIHDVLAGEATLSAAAYEGPHGVYVIPGSNDLDSFRRADPARLGEALSVVSSVDYVIVDTSAGLTHESALPLSLADGVLLVTTPDRDALSATRKSSELTQKLGGTVAGVAVNRARDDSADPDAGAPLLGRIPESPDLAAGSAAGEPITVRSPGGDVALAFRRLASRLAVERVPPPPEVDDARAGPGAATAEGADATDGGPRHEEVPRGAPGGADPRRNAASAGPTPTDDQTHPARGDSSPESNTEPSPETDPALTDDPQPESDPALADDPQPESDPALADDPQPESDPALTDDPQPESDPAPTDDQTPEMDPDREPAPDERIDDDGVIIRDDTDEQEDPAAAEARRTVLGEAVPESAISREETARGNAVEYEIDEDAIPFSEDDDEDEDKEEDEDEEEDDGGFLGRLFRS